MHLRRRLEHRGLVSSIEKHRGLVSSIEKHRGLVSSIVKHRGLGSVSSIEKHRGLVPCVLAPHASAPPPTYLLVLQHRGLVSAQRFS
jgi:hypothetical protein